MQILSDSLLQYIIPIINLIHCIAMYSFFKSYLPHYLSLHCIGRTTQVNNHLGQSISVAKQCRCPVGKPRVSSSIPGGVKYFHFKFFAYFSSFQVNGALAKEIKNDL